jgi:tRNA modification GTPase
LSTPLNQLRESLLDLLAHLEAGLDFVDEDIEFITAAELAARLDQAGAKVARLAAQMHDRADTAAAPRAVLLGPPNVGKSSLFNALAAALALRQSGRTAALTSPEPGTTRDYLTVRLDLGGLTCELVDTAGLEADPRDHTARGAAQSMTRQQQTRADVQLVCLDASQTWSVTDLSPPATEPTAGGRLLVLTKCDLARPGTPTDPRIATGIATSAASGEGIDQLGKALRAALTAAGSDDAGCVAATAARCHESLAAAAASLLRARQCVDGNSGEEFVAAELRAALTELGKVTGAVYTDDILDRIFSRFCIGK